MPEILIASRDEAIDILSDPKYNRKVTAIVSISDYRKSIPKPVIKCQDVQLTSHADRGRIGQITKCYRQITRFLTPIKS